MKNIKTREEFDAIAKDLIGLTLASVTYFEIEYETNERCYLHQLRIGHFLEYKIGSHAKNA